MTNENLYNSPDVANAIKESAKSKGISLKELLNRCELGSNTFSHMLHGKAIAFDSLARIADCLNCSVDFLLGRKNNQFTIDEQRIVEEYRSVTDEGKKAIKKYITYVSNDEQYKKFEDAAKEA